MKKEVTSALTNVLIFERWIEYSPINEIIHDHLVACAIVTCNKEGIGRHHTANLLINCLVNGLQIALCFRSRKNATNFYQGCSFFTTLPRFFIQFSAFNNNSGLVRKQFQ